MVVAAKVTEPEHITSTPAMTVETTSNSDTPCEQPANGAAPVANPVVSEVSASAPMPAAPIKDESVDADEAMQEDAANDASESEEDSDSDSDSDSSDEGKEILSSKAPPVVALTDASGRPLSDIEIAAQYAAIEIQSIASQFATAVVDPAKLATAPLVPSTSNGSGVATVDAVEKEEKADDAMGETTTTGVAAESSDDDDSSDDEDERDDKDDARKLRAEIEAAMEKEENKVSGPLKTVNEVAALPVREPQVKELTPDCPIARCGTVLNVSRPGLIVTIKSDHGVKPLDEGSVFCFEDRTVLGCVDEVFGPVLMPMYLVRFEHADKIPAQTDINLPVYYATEHTTYIIPENIRDKGTDASNLFDEETDETLYSDDEAEAAAKRQNRKRNRGGDHAHAAPSAEGGSGPVGNFTDYQGGRPHGNGSGRGRGRGRGGRGPPNNDRYNQQYQNHHAHAVHTHTPFQAQPHGGVTRYTTPGYPGQPGGQGYPPAPGQYQPSGGAPAYGGVPPYQQGQYGQAPPPPRMPTYAPPPYGAPQQLPPYPPQAPPSNYYQQPSSHGYAQPPLPPPPPPGHYGPPSGYYQGQQPNPNAYNQQGHHQPPPPGGAYGPQGGRHH